MSRTNDTDRRSGRRASISTVQTAFDALFVRGTDYLFTYENGHRAGTTAVDYYDPTHTMAPTGGTATIVTTSSRFHGRPALSCVDTTLASSRAASAFKRGHDGTGGSLVVASCRNAQGTNPALFNTRAGGVDPGVVFRGDTVGDNGVYYLSDAAGTPLALSLAIGNGWVVGIPVSHYHSYSESRTPEIRLRQSGLDQVSQASLVAPSNANPGSTLTIAGVGTNASILSVFGFARVLSAAEEAIVSAYMTAQWGLTL